MFFSKRQKNTFFQKNGTRFGTYDFDSCFRMVGRVADQGAVAQVVVFVGHTIRVHGAFTAHVGPLTGAVHALVRFGAVVAVIAGLGRPGDTFCGPPGVGDGAGRASADAAEVGRASTRERHEISVRPRSEQTDQCT